jgi:hypothetical protein
MKFNLQIIILKKGNFQGTVRRLNFIVYYHNIAKYILAENLWFQCILSINHSFVYCRKFYNLKYEFKIIDTEEEKTKRSQ